LTSFKFCGIIYLSIAVIFVAAILFLKGSNYLC
jgi:hypothetical protein